MCGSYTCTDSKGKKDTCYKYSCTAGAASGCKKGEPGKDKCKVKNQEAALWSAFKAAVNNITQLVYELENCNLYKTEDLKLYYDSASYVDLADILLIDQSIKVLIHQQLMEVQQKIIFLNLLTVRAKKDVYL